MATLAELTRQYTSLDTAEVEHLQRLLGEWGLLADLSFADLLLYVPEAHDGPRVWRVLAHVRPATGQTIYQADYVGATLSSVDEIPLLAKAFDEGEICEGEITVEEIGRAHV